MLINEKGWLYCMNIIIALSWNKKVKPSTWSCLFSDFVVWVLLIRIIQREAMNCHSFRSAQQEVIRSAEVQVVLCCHLKTSSKGIQFLPFWKRINSDHSSLGWTSGSKIACKLYCYFKNWSVVAKYLALFLETMSVEHCQYSLF